jgi:hypothetical protein
LIETATLSGTGDNPALRIKDASKGIEFIGSTDSELVFKVTTKEFIANVENSINLNGCLID